MPRVSWSNVCISLGFLSYVCGVSVYKLGRDMGVDDLFINNSTTRCILDVPGRVFMRNIITLSKQLVYTSAQPIVATIAGVARSFYTFSTEPINTNNLNKGTYL